MKIGLVKYKQWFRVGAGWSIYYKTSNIYLDKAQWNVMWFYGDCFAYEANKYTQKEAIKIMKGGDKKHYYEHCNEKLNELLMAAKNEGYIEDYHIIEGKSVEELVGNIKEMIILMEII